MKPAIQALLLRAASGNLPADFDQYQQADSDGWSVAHEAATYGKLPASFKRFDLKDSAGWTVAHVVALRGPLPADFNQWHLKDSEGVTVADVAFAHGHLPKDFDWARAKPPAPSVAASVDAGVPAAANDGDVKLARELQFIAHGDYWSDNIVRAGIKRLEEIKAHGTVDSYITVERVDETIGVWRRALQGERNFHGEQEGVVMIATYQQRLDAANGLDGQEYQKQVTALQETTKALNAAFRPEANIHDFQPAKLQELAEDHGFKVVSVSGVRGDGTREACLVRGDADGAVREEISLFLSSDSQLVSGHSKIAQEEGTTVRVERDNVLAALDASVEAVEQLGAEFEKKANGPDSDYMSMGF